MERDDGLRSKEREREREREGGGGADMAEGEETRSVKTLIDEGGGGRGWKEARESSRENGVKKKK